MRFPPSFIERLRSHFLMSEVVGRRIPIKKHGREFHALCPFHNEKTPSFTINDEKGFYHCFGCGAHGDAIEFIRRYERLSYPETIETLAREAGIPLPELTPEEEKKIEAAKTLYDVLEAACKWFEKQLTAPGGGIARDYLEKRGLKPETLRAFRIGYAPDSRTALNQHLQQLGFPQALQAEAGLIILPEGGGAPYDRFRARAIFPIRDGKGRVVAFGGRLIAADAPKTLPKYLNSPETPLFKKGELLYNLDLAKSPARETGLAVVMEGYMDVVSVAQAGVSYAVATLGTAVTPEHLRLLWRLTKEPVMCLDGDAAGKRAMLRAAEVALPLLKPGYSLRFATLPSGEDPDSYVGKYGKAALEKLFNPGKRLSQVLWEALSPNYNISLPEGRAALEGTLKTLTDKITDPTVRTHYLSYFKRLIWDHSRTASKPEPARSAHIERLVVQPDTAALEMQERKLLRILIDFPQLLNKSRVEETLSRMDIKNPRLDALRQALLTVPPHAEFGDRGRFAAWLATQFTDELPGGMLPAPWRELAFEDAALLWHEEVSVYEEEHEVIKLKQQLEREWDEQLFARLDELIKKRAGRAAALEPDAA